MSATGTEAKVCADGGAVRVFDDAIDGMEATRRAIVRAAAEIGRNMP